MFSRRINILKQWIKRNNNEVTLSEIVNHVFYLTAKYQALPKVHKIELADNNFLVYFKGYNLPLYYPAEMNLNSLYQVFTETNKKNNWHYYEIAETTVEKHEIIADCGSAEGLFGLKNYNRSEKIYLIEPLNRFVEVLKLTFRNVDNVEIIPKGLSDREGYAYITNHDISSSINDKDEGEEIQLTTLDNLFFHRNQKITYLKADLEGYEMSMLKGGIETIKNYKPKIAITTYHKKGDYKEITELLKKLNPNYKFKYKGIEDRYGEPVMLHAWQNTGN